LNLKLSFGDVSGKSGPDPLLELKKPIMIIRGV